MSAARRPSQAAQRLLNELAPQVESFERAQELWRLLNDRDKLFFDYSLESAIAQSRPGNGAVGMWMRLRNCSREQAVLEMLGRLTNLNHYVIDLLRLEFGLGLQYTREETPVWDRDRRELKLNGRVIRRVSASAMNVLRILDNFQDNDWPPRIDNPLDFEVSGRRLGAAVAQLNKGLTELRFRCDGTGGGLEWNFASS